MEFLCSCVLAVAVEFPTAEEFQPSLSSWQFQSSHSVSDISKTLMPLSLSCPLLAQYGENDSGYPTNVCDHNCNGLLLPILRQKMGLSGV
jgi:hypothetical protein